MLDDDGKEVPGSRGYKYFGRAKDLPGVKEMLNRTAEQEAEAESFRSQKFKRFANQPPEYYGDLDEDDGILLESEIEAETQAWRRGYADLLEELEEEVKILPFQVPFCGDLNPELECDISCYEDSNCQTLGFDFNKLQCACAAQVSIC